METSVNTALAPPKTNMDSSSPNTDSKEASNFHSPMEEFGKRLEKIIITHGSAAGLLNKQVGQVTSTWVTYKLLNINLKLLMEHMKVKECM